MGAEAAAAEPDSALGRVAASGGKVTGRDVVAAAQGGDQQATRLVGVLGERLGIGIASAINVFDPEEVVIGGGVDRGRRAAAGAGPPCRPRLRVAGSGPPDRDPCRPPRRRRRVRGAALLAAKELVAS